MVAALLKQEGPGTITVIFHLYMVVAHLDMEVAQVAHLHRKDIVVAVSFQQEDLVPHHLDTTAQLTKSVETMPLLFKENLEEVQQTPTRPLGTLLKMDHTGGIIRKGTPFKTLN